MALFQEKSEKKSLVITVIINTVLILLLFFFGLTYMDPPEEGGIAINFGTSEVVSGDTQPNTPVESSPTAEQKTEENTPEESAEPEDSPEEESITQDIEDAPVIDDAEEKEKEENKNEEEKNEEVEKEAEPEPEPDPEPDKSTSDALKNILSGKEQEGESSKGEGDDNQAGDKGDPSGDPNASSYYGKGEGLDGDGNYRLGGRKALNKEKFTQECNESGIVVVEIKVNRNGEVIQAKPGVKGTTNTSSCLLNPAKRAAEATKFNPDSKAPSVQTGEIIYEFKLSE